MKEEAYENNILHPKFSQTNVVTGRLSCSDPNFQNIPRGDKLLKRVIQSRFDNGEIIEMDFAQLEFRVAAFLSQDSQAMQDILEGVDVHQNTADVIGCNRQDAKAHTFKPLYGGMSEQMKRRNTILILGKDIKVLLHGKRQQRILLLLLCYPTKQ